MINSTFNKRDLVIIKYFLEELENAELLNDDKKMILRFCQYLSSFSCLDLRKKKAACPFSMYWYEGDGKYQIVCSCKDEYDDILGIDKANFCPLDQLESEQVKQLLL